MKILLLYFTGTYNTLYLTTLIKNHLLNNGNDVDSFDIASIKKVKFNDYDLIGIGYPIYCFNAPKIIEETFKKAKISNKKYFIYKNGRNYNKLNNASSNKLVNILNKKSNEFMGEYTYLMPSNIMYKSKDGFIKHLINYNLKHIKYMCKNLENKKTYKISLIEKVISFLGRFQRVICKTNIKSYKVIKNKCIRCRKCFNLCPTNNIVYNKQKRNYEFKNNCTMCMRCSYVCPTNAIKIGLIESFKISGTYDYLMISQIKDTYSFENEKERKYKKLKPYFDYINSLNIS